MYGRPPTALVSLSVTPVESFILSATIPVPPTRTVTVQSLPLPVTLCTVEPAALVPVSSKFAAVTPVTFSLKRTM